MNAPRPKSGALGTVLVGVAILVIAWLAVRTLTKKQQADFQAGTFATTGRSPGMPIVPPIPSAVVSAAGKAGIVRVDLVLRVNGVDVASDGAPACRANNATKIGRDSQATVGSFDEAALRGCFASLMPSWGDRKPIVVITRAGDAVPKTFLDALAAASRRSGAHEIVMAP